MTDSSLQQNVEEIVREAAALMTRDFTVKSKGTIANQVTSNDVAVENFLKESLQKILPGSGFIAEESSHGETTTEYTWIIDPIDGTANYVRDLANSGISVGLYKNMQPFIGVVYNPYRQEREQEPFVMDSRSMFLTGILHIAAFALLCPAITKSRRLPAQRYWNGCLRKVMISDGLGQQ